MAMAIVHRLLLGSRNEMLSQSYPDPAAQASGEGRRERLKRLRVEMAAGRVCVPESWGQEGRLKDWADCSAFGGSLAAAGAGAATARDALAEECRKASSRNRRVEVENRC